MDKVKNHFKKHKNKYLIGLGAVACVGAGVGVGYSLGTHHTLKAISKTPQQPQVVNTISPVFNNDNSSSNVVNMGGHQSKLVECLETGEIWKSVNEAASSAGVHPTNMSKHLNGRSDKVNGKTYAIVGVSTSG